MKTRRQVRLGMFRAVLIGLTLLSLPSLLWAGADRNRFFLVGDGKLHIKDEHTGKEASVSLLNPDGSLNDEGFNKIDALFGFPTQEMGEHISPRLLFMLDYFSDRVAPGKTIHMISGYRSPDYNTNLRKNGGNVAKTSIHMEGMALDFYIDGVNGKKLWEIVKEKECGGVGNYGGSSIHLDSARPRFWEAGTSKVRTGESDYNRRIYLTTDYDRYKAGEPVRLSLVSVSDFGFGIQRSVSLVEDSAEGKTVATADLITSDHADTFMVPDRKAAHFIRFNLPSTLHPGRYRVKIDFCKRPYEQMPLNTLSNPIELQ